MVELDKVLAYARIKLPASQAWKRKVAEFCAEHLDEIRVFRALGPAAIQDPVRRRLVWSHIGDCNGHEPDEYGFNVWLLNECVGDWAMDDELIFYLCKGCQRIRTNRNIRLSPYCRYCASRGGLPYKGPTETRDNLYRIIMGD